MYKEPFSDMRWGFHREAVWRPPTDVFETDGSAVVIVEIAGLREHEFDISLMGHTLVITGERRDPAEKLTYQQMEIRYGKFRTQVYVPWALDSTRIEATYDSGFLKVVLPKAQPHKVSIELAQDGESSPTESSSTKEG